MIEVNSLTKRFKDVTAVDDVSFTVPSGAVTGLLGPNGAGKSTTMRLILGLDTQDSGTATVDGRRYREHPRPLTVVGAQFDGAGAHRARRAVDHLRWVAQSNGIATSRVPEVLDLVGLGAAAKRRVGTFSLGMGQRLGLATALLGRPGNLILDEPTNGLDPEGIRWIRQMLRRLADDGVAVLVSSHQMAEMQVVADHLVVIARGRVVQAGPTAALVERHDNLEAAYFSWTEGAGDYTGRSTERGVR